MALTLTDDQAAALLDALGLPADTTDAALVVDTTKDLAAQAVSAADASQPSQVAAAAQRHGMEASADDAISKGKITPSRRGHWVTLIQADPGMADVLASVPNETAVPMTELGHSTEPQTRDGDAGPKWFDDF